MPKARLVGSDLMDQQPVPELRKRAKQLGITGYSGARKADLIAKIRNS